MDKHHLHSSTREEYVEYILLAELCSFGWSRDRFVEVARTQTDAQGYDLMLACDGVIRHVQLKASKAGGRTATQNVNVALADKPGGCVVWIVVEPETLRPEAYSVVRRIAGRGAARPRNARRPPHQGQCARPQGRARCHQGHQQGKLPAA